MVWWQKSKNNAKRAKSDRLAQLEEYWKHLSDGIHSVQTREPMSKTRFVELYTIVYDYCARHGTNAQLRENVAVSRSANRLQNGVLNDDSSNVFVGQDLYEKLREWLKENMEQLEEECSGKVDESLLTFYAEEWKQFTFTAKVINGIFSYLNRHFVRQNSEAAKPNVLQIFQLALDIWKETVFETTRQNLTTGVLKLIDNERNGEAINASTVKSIVNSFVAIGLSDRGEPISGENPHNDLNIPGDLSTGLPIALGTYQRYFEVNYMQNLREYYLKESHDYLTDNENTVLDFIKQVEQRLLDEEVRAEKYLHPSSFGRQKLEIQETLIRKNLDVIYLEFKDLLEAEKFEEIFRTYSLVRKLDGALGEMGEVFRVYVASVGNTVLAMLGSSVSDPNSFVNSILNVYRKFTALVDECFNADPVFKAGLDRACEDFVNKNDWGLDENQSKFKSAELLARYCDLLLKKSNKTLNEQEVEDRQNGVMTIFKFLQDKDAFQKYYSVKLANRLTQQLSASDDAESAMIAKLKHLCGFEYTSKLQRMYQDVNLSRELQDEFKKSGQFQQDPRLPLDFQILVLSTGSWPFSHCGNEFTPPVELEPQIQAFYKFYTAKHNGRKLSWLYSRSTGELTYNRSEGKLHIQASVYQIAALLLFNSNDAYQFGEIRENTKLDPNVLKQVLDSLVRFNLCKCDGEVDADSLIKLNKDYKNNKSRVKINGPLKNGAKKDVDKIDKAVQEGRDLLIQAAIVRIMKMRKTIGHQELVAEVMRQMSNQFRATVPSIKKCIDILIQKDYMERQEGQKDVYSYLA